jgi:polysaccharide export outer membrane protein
MMRVLVAFFLLVCGAALSGCAHHTYNMPYGAAAYQRFPGSQSAGPPPEYKIGAFDKVNVVVYREPDLSANDVPVDAAGEINMPLIGNVHIEGITAEDASSYIAKRFNEKYLRDAQVTVTVTEAVSKRVVVEGEVNQPGVFPIQGRMTLLEALAQARGTTKTSANKEIVIFRVIDGQRLGGRFNLDDIREGKADDPELKGSDTVVVGYSAVKGAFKDFLSSAPLIGVFTRF